MFNNENKVRNMILNDKNINRLYKESCAPIIFKELDVDGLYDYTNRCIILNKNIKDDRKLRETLIHECIHSYDHISRRINLSDIDGLIRSEIRANKFADFGQKSDSKSKVYEYCYDSISRTYGKSEDVNERFAEKFDAIYDEESSLF